MHLDSHHGKKKNCPLMFVRDLLLRETLTISLWFSASSKVQE